MSKLTTLKNETIDSLVRQLRCLSQVIDVNTFKYIIFEDVIKRYQDSLRVENIENNPYLHTL